MVRIHKLKQDRQHNDQKKKDKRTSETTRARSKLVKKFEAGNFKWNIKKKS
jgi:hypothetical protein